MFEEKNQFRIIQLENVFDMGEDNIFEEENPLMENVLSGDSGPPVENTLSVENILSGDLVEPVENVLSEEGNPPTTKTTIKHLVLSGGGSTGIRMIGALQHLEKNGFWNIENIRTIYGTSIGAVIGLLMALKFDDWTTITDYVIKRPWHDAFPVGVNEFFEAFSKKGLFDSSVFLTFFKPFFLAKDLSPEITMKEFFEYSGIELHFFTLELNTFQVVNVSYKTFPDLKLLDAIHMTCALPIVVAPVCLEDGKCYVDGGVVYNYPLGFCLEEQMSDETEILAFKNDYILESEKMRISRDSTILDYMMTFINKLMMNVDTEGKQPRLKNEIICRTLPTGLYTLKSALYSAEFRLELLKEGIQSGIDFLEKMKSNIQ
jgi:predicted acylesterase/phospholipase RssA